MTDTPFLWDSSPDPDSRACFLVSDDKEERTCVTLTMLIPEIVTVVSVCDRVLTTAMAAGLVKGLQGIQNPLLHAPATAWHCLA